MRYFPNKSLIEVFEKLLGFLKKNSLIVAAPCSILFSRFLYSPSDAMSERGCSKEAHFSLHFLQLHTEGLTR